MKGISFALSLLAAVIAIVLSNIIVGFYLSFINRNYVNPAFRKVPISLLLLSIFSVLLYYVGQIV